MISSYRRMHLNLEMNKIVRPLFFYRVKKMKIVAVRIGDKYGQQYEEYLESKLPEYEFIWVREPIREDVILQWNKMYGMSLDIDEPICVMDIDIILTNDYKEVFEFPIKRGEFAYVCQVGGEKMQRMKSPTQ